MQRKTNFRLYEVVFATCWLAMIVVAIAGHISLLIIISTVRDRTFVGVI